MTGLLERAAGAWWAWAAPMAIQAGLLVLVIALLDHVLRRLRAWPSLRMALWSLAVLRLVLPPSLGSPVSLTAPLLAPALGPAAAGVPGGAVPSAPTALFLAWAAGAFLFLLRDGAAAMRNRRILLAPAALVPVPPAAERALAAAAARLGLRRPPRLVVSRAADGAAVIGVFRPVILLPAGEAAPRPRDLEHVLLHECAHLLRRDPLRRAAGALLRALHWYHPLVHLAVARAEALREACCDATVAAVLREGTAAYRGTLLRSARRLVAGKGPGVTAGISWAGGGGGLADRIRSLEGTPWRHAARRRAATGILCAAVAAGVLPMASPLPPPGPFRPGGPAGGAAVRAAAREGEETGPSPARVAAARNLIDRAMSGKERPGCVRVRYATYVLAWAESVSATDGTPRGDRP